MFMSVPKSLQTQEPMSSDQSVGLGPATIFEVSVAPTASTQVSF